MDKSFKISESLVYASITLSSVLYAGFLVSDKFYFRIAALVFSACFYGLIVLFCLERRRLLWRQIQHTSKGLFAIYLLIVCIPLLYSFKTDLKSLMTLFFHPLAFGAFFIAVVALTVQEGTPKQLQRFAQIVNNLLPFALIADLALFKKPGFINEMNFLLLIELLFWRTLTAGRRTFLLLLMAVIIVVELYFNNRMIALRLLSVTTLFFAFSLFPFLRSKLLRVTGLVAGFLVLYLLSFHFEASFNFIADHLPFGQIDTTDTRSFLYDEFFDTFKGSDWIGGRGYMGTYFSPWFYSWEGDDGDYFQRFSLEVGVLQILLKGGLLLLVPFYLIYCRTLYKGFVLAKTDTLNFNFSIFLFVQLMITGVENYPLFDVNFMLIWIAMGIVLFMPKQG